MNTLTPSKLLAPELVEKSIETTFRISNSLEGSLVHLHVHVLYIIQELLKPRTYLEIGTHNGGSLATVMQYDSPCHFFGVDTWDCGGPNKRLYQGSLEGMELTRRNIENHNPHDHPVSLIRGNSMDDRTFVEVQKNCPCVDFLFIDGGHDYDNVMNDFLRFSPLVSPGGVIVFDDYLYLEKEDFNHLTPEEKKRKGQVRQAVDDIVKKLAPAAYNVIGTLPNQLSPQMQPLGIVQDNIQFIIQRSQ